MSIIRRILSLTLVPALAAGLFLTAPSLAQEEVKRKVKTRVTPFYPELARRLSVSGKVKIEVVIAPDGHIKSTRVIGGHPLLVPPSLEALKEWRFVPASEETTQIVEFEFKALSN